VLDTLKWLKKESNVWFEITNLMIPGENDSADETKKMCDWIVKELGTDVPVHFTAFHPDFRLTDRPNTPPPTLMRAWRIALEAGIKYVYTGNINDKATQSTYCHACKNLVIERDWYNIGEYKMNGNCCGHCGEVIPGHFDKLDGIWGRKRMSVHFNR
jgi:pyruvate formate lyase activating enzyme